MPTYPATLPKPRIDGMTETRGNNIIRTQMDAGAPKQRRRYTKQIDQWQFNIIVDATQMAAFEAFFDTQLQDGQFSFDWTHPRLGTTVTARFVQPPSYTFLGNNKTQINHVLEILP